MVKQSLEKFLNNGNPQEIAYVKASQETGIPVVILKLLSQKEDGA